MNIHSFFKSLVTLIVLGAASATAAPTVTLTADKTELTAAGQITLTWSATGAKSCVADWTTSTAVSGSQAVNVTTARDYTITCSGATPSVKIAWTAPTKNTDGSAVKISGYNIFKDATQAALVAQKNTKAGTKPWINGSVLNSPTVLSYTATDLPAGTHWFAVTAFYCPAGAACTESDQSASISKTLTAESATAKVSVVFSIRPNPPTGVTAQ